MPRSRWEIGTDCFLVLIRSWRNGKAVLNLHLEISLVFFPHVLLKESQKKRFKAYIYLKSSSLICNQLYIHRVLIQKYAYIFLNYLIDTYTYMCLSGMGRGTQCPSICLSKWAIVHTESQGAQRCPTPPDFPSSICCHTVPMTYGTGCCFPEGDV